MVYRELGRYPLEIQVKTRMIAYSSKLLTGKETKLSKLFYSLTFQLNQKIVIIDCLDCIKTTLNHCGLSNIWLE